MKPFALWQAEQSNHYKCLDTTELDIIVEIPSSLYTLLTKAMEGTKTEESCAHIATHKIKITIYIKTATKGPAAADNQDQVIDAVGKLTLNNDTDVHTDLVMDEAITDVNALLALVIVFKCYPDAWKELFFWDAWLAVAVQLCIQGRFGNIEVFPTLWMDSQGIFFAEKHVDPEKVRCLLFGQDPVPKSSQLQVYDLRKATGIAFHNIGNENSSISNMGKYYGLDCSDDNPIKHCEKGILIVNMIRCIFENDRSMDENEFRKAWTAYTLKLANHFDKSKQVSKIIVFCKSAYKPCLATKYLPKVVSKEKFMEVPHPSKVWNNELYRDAPETTDDVKEVAKYLKTESAIAS